MSSQQQKESSGGSSGSGRRLQPLPLAPTTHYYVALGDRLSMDALGGGAGNGAASLLRHNRDDTYPDWRGRDLGAVVLPGGGRHGTPPRLIPLAMSDSTAATVRYVQLPRLREMKIQASLVTLTIGATDLLLSQGLEENIEAALSGLQEHISVVLAELRRDLLLPGAPLIIATVPDPTGGAATTLAARFTDVLRELSEKQGARIAEIEYEPSVRQEELPHRVRAAFWRALVESGTVTEETGGSA